MVNQYEQGKEAENLVRHQFEELGYKVFFDDSWYDLRIIKNKIQHLIEVKSTNLILSNGSSRITYGRFDFTEVKNRRLQRKHNVTICFVVRVHHCFEILGFSQSKTIKAKRYVTLKSLFCNHTLKTITSFSKYLEKKYNGKNKN